MPTLDSSNIQNNNIIQPNDLLQLYEAFQGNFNVTISGSLTGSATNSVTSSFSHTASFSISSSHSNTSEGSKRIIEQYYTLPTGSGIQQGSFNFIAGKTTMNSNEATSSAYPVLIGKTLNQNTFITANFNTNPVSSENLRITNISGDGEILFDCSGVTGPADIGFIGIIIV